MATRAPTPSPESRVHDLPPGDPRIRHVAHSRPGGPEGAGRRRQAEQTWTIAQVAEEFGVTHRTVRHYEELGLISPERHGTRRLYRRRDRTRLALILRGKRLGFPLEEIRTIIDLYDAPRGRRSQLEYVLDQIDERRADLEQRRADIEAALAELDGFEARCRDELTALR